MTDNEQGSLDPYEDFDRLLARYPNRAPDPQIPGVKQQAAPQESSKSLRDRAASLLVQANPLMVQKSLQDMTRTLVGGAALPVVAPISAGVQYLNALPGNLYRRSQGQETIDTPSAEELMVKYGQAIAPRTEMGRDFESGLAKVLDTAKVPHAWSVSPVAPRRPMLTPTDVRVGTGQIKQLAKELRETPADFQAAQSGLKRQNLYGEDTIGVKAQAAADALGDTLERRKSSGLSTIPGIPDALVPDTKMYAVRPKGTRMVQPKVPESAKGARPDFDDLNELAREVYGDTPAAQMPPEMVMAEYARRYLPNDSELRAAVTNYSMLKAQEMYPDAPSPEDALAAYNALYLDRTARNKQQLADVEEFLTNVVPEYRQNTPTPSEFMQRMAEAERVVKGPFTTYISKNVGAEGDPTVKLARQGITFETPENILQSARYADDPSLAKRRVEGGFPILGTYAEEHFRKSAEFDALTREIEALEQVRQPLFEQAQAEGIDPATIPGYAETTNPLRQKLRQREQIEGDIKNIELARAVENISDYSVTPRSKQLTLERIPYADRQFFPSVTKAADDEKLYTGRRRIFEELGFEKLGKDLVEDILTGKAGDTSKLTIENYMREKGLSRIEAEKAAKLQEQKYRETLQNTLLDRLKNDQNVKTFGNAAIITLDQNTPTDVAMRDMSTDTLVLDHCVGKCGTAPQGRRNILTGRQQQNEPVIDPVTGERSSRASGDTRYVRDLRNGHQLVSVRDAKTGLPAATLQLVPSGEGGNTFRIGYASGAENGAIDPAYIPAIRDYLNERSADIYSPGSNLADNAGIFDTTSPNEFRKAAREAGLTNDQARALDAESDLPRFVTVDDVKAAAKGITASPPAVAVQRSAPASQGRPIPDLSADDLLAGYGQQMTREQRDWLGSFVRNWENNVDDTPAGGELADRMSAMYQRWRQENTLQPDPVDNLFDDIGNFEPDDTAAANNPMLQYPPATRELAFYYGIPPEIAQEIEARFAVPRVPLADLNDLARNAVARAPGTVFANMPEEARGGAEQMIRDEIARRAATMAEVGVREPGPNIPLGVLQEIRTRFRDPEVEVADLSMMRDNARARVPRTLFANLTQLESDSVANMITEEIERRIAVQDYDLLAEAAPAQPALQLAERNPVPRNIQELTTPDLIRDLSPAWNRQAQELADTYFNDNLIDDNNVTISSLAGMLRNYRVGPHAQAPAEVRELAARRLESLHEEAQGGAEQVADALNEAFYMDMDPEEALDQISRDVSMLERDGENSWEDVAGPLSEDIPWSRNLQHHLIGYLRALADQYADRREQGFAKGGRVKKKHMAKKDGMPLSLIRKSPELTEMAYRYGGMV